MSSLVYKKQKIKSKSVGSQNNLKLFADKISEHSPGLLSNNSGYSCPVSVLLNSKCSNKKSEKEKKGSQINRFHGAGHLFRENIRKCRYIPLICALSFAGF